MNRTQRTEREKELRELYEQYSETWRSRNQHGHWVDVEPYQRGWIRSFTLRDDIKNRRDARYIKQALDLINNRVYSHREDFLHRDWKTGKWVPIEQRVHSIPEKKWEGLSTNLQKLFERRLMKYQYSNHTYYAYCIKYEWYFVFKIEPNMIDQHWVPDSDWETHCAEIRNRIDRNHLWPKINKALGVSRYHTDYDWYPVWLRHKHGDDIVIYDEDLSEE